METVAKQLGSRVVAAENSAKLTNQQLAEVQNQKRDSEVEVKDCKRAIKELSTQARVENAALADKERVGYERMRELKEKYDELLRDMELRSDEHAKVKVRSLRCK
jgi:hypothetical protein